MGWSAHDRAFLRQHLDAQGDLAPPWERFPDYERYTIGWRMGGGEEWMWARRLCVEQLGPDFETRAVYLRRHAPAPTSWADAVHGVLVPRCW